MNGIAPAIPDLLARLPLFAGLSAEQSARICRGGVRQLAVDRGEIVLRRGDPAHHIFFVLTGQVTLSVSSPEGADKIVEIINAGESFGEAVVFIGACYPVTAEALVPTELLSVSGEAVLDLLDRDPLFARRMLANVSVRLHRLVRDVESYSLRSGIQRVIGFLLHQLPDRSGESTVMLPVSKHVLASRLNLAPETFSRLLHHLSAAGLVSVHGRRVTLHDVPRLSAELEWR